MKYLLGKSLLSFCKKKLLDHRIFRHKGSLFSGQFEPVECGGLTNERALTYDVHLTTGYYRYKGRLLSGHFSPVDSGGLTNKRALTYNVHLTTGYFRHKGRLLSGHLASVESGGFQVE